MNTSSSQSIAYSPIGVIRSGHKVAGKTPIQPVFAGGCRGRIVVFPEYAEGLSDLDGFSHIYLIYHFHKAGPLRLRVKPFLQDVERGLFATRATCRPNPIGISIVRLLRRRGCTLHVDGIDVLDGTPLLDIKPYTARFDCIRTLRNGWHDELDGSATGRRGCSRRRIARGRRR